MSKRYSLITGFINSLEHFPNRPALEVDNHSFTYQQLGDIVSRITAVILEAQPSNRDLAAILAYRSIAAYAGVLGILASGRGYVPLNPRFPAERTLSMLTLSQTDVVIVGRECLPEFETLLPGLKRPMKVLLVDSPTAGDLPGGYPQHLFFASDSVNATVQPTPRLAPVTVNPDAIAYLLFTSGSTGTPKGVPVSHSNVAAYLAYTCQRYGVNEQDRFSQMFDMTFDLSVHDLFVCWERGACLCAMPEKVTMAPAEFIREKELTMWFSVPSVAMFLSRYRMLKPDSLPSLRYSLFCGEALSASLADQWQKAASNSIVENLYGPTETTVAITNYRWDPVKSPRACVNGIVPIGWPFEGQRAAIIDPEKRLLPAGEIGELCLCGSQVTRGYLNNPEKTHQHYIQIQGLGGELWYRTGDLVRQDETGCLHYLGRTDNQVKILGHRVELGEIDAVLRQATGSELAVAVAWPVQFGHASGIVAFVCLNEEQADHAHSKSLIQDACKKMLPVYMIPKKVYFIDSMPLNVNGKINRLKLVELLEEKGPSNS
jgi:amino acid adenylation domain-containing protein